MNRLLLGLIFINWSAWALNEQMKIEYRRACESDIDSIVHLMDESSSEADKLVVLPKNCREPFVRELIDKKYLFVAAVDNKVIATKKLFIAEGAEREDILKGVIHSKGPKIRLSFRGKVNEGGSVDSYFDPLVAPSAPAYGVCIYDGFDYTRKAFRGLGVNSGLFKVAFELIAPEVKTALRKTGEKTLSLLYGLAYPNASENPGKEPDRTPSIARSFQAFIRKHIDAQGKLGALEISRYYSFMPTFSPGSKDCNNPLPDEESEPIYGYVLTYELKNNCI